MSKEEADQHIQSVRNYSAKLLAFVQPSLESLTGKTDKEIAKGLSNTYVFPDAANDYNKKLLGTWTLDCMLMLWKHGLCNDADLRPMRTGDCFKFQFATVNSATGFGSWIMFGDDDQVYASIKNSSTKISASARIPLHDRCSELAKLLKRVLYRHTRCCQPRTERRTLPTLYNNASTRTLAFLFKIG